MRYLLAVVAAVGLTSVGRCELIELAPPGVVGQPVEFSTFPVIGISGGVVAVIEEPIAVHSLGVRAQSPELNFGFSIFNPSTFDFASFGLKLPNDGSDWFDVPVGVVLKTGTYWIDVSFTSDFPSTSDIFPRDPFSGPLYQAGPITIFGGAAFGQPRPFALDLRADIMAIPEPASWLLAITSLALLGWHRRLQTRSRRCPGR